MAVTKQEKEAAFSNLSQQEQTGWVAKWVADDSVLPNETVQEWWYDTQRTTEEEGPEPFLKGDDTNA